MTSPSSSVSRPSPEQGRSPCPYLYARLGRQRTEGAALPFYSSQQTDSSVEKAQGRHRGARIARDNPAWKGRPSRTGFLYRRSAAGVRMYSSKKGKRAAVGSR